MGSTAIIYAAVAVGIALACLVVGRTWGRSAVKSQVEDALEAARKSADAREFTIREQLDQKMAEVSRLAPLADEVGRLRAQLKHRPNVAQSSAGFDSASTHLASDPRVQAEIPPEPEETAPPVESADETIQKLLQSLEASAHQPEEEPAAAVVHPVGEPRPVPEPRPVVQKMPPAAPAPVVQNRPPVDSRPASAPQPTAPPRPNPLPRPAAAPPPAPAPRPAPVSRPAAAAPPPAAPVRPNPIPRPATAVPPPRPSAIPGPPAASRPAAASKPANVQPPPPASQPAAKPRPNSQPGTVDEWQEFARSLEALTQRKQ